MQDLQLILKILDRIYENFRPWMYFPSLIQLGIKSKMRHCNNLKNSQNKLLKDLDAVKGRKANPRKKKIYIYIY